MKAQLPCAAELVGLDLLAPHDKAPISSTTIVACTASGTLTLTPFSHLLSSTPPSPAKPPGPLHSLGSNVTRMRLHPSPSTPLIASGGRENLLKVHDLATQQLTFKAKNVPHDRLNLRLPVHLTDVRFLPSSPSLLVEGTATKQLRFYDIRAKKQPTSCVQVGEHAVSTLTVTDDEVLVIAGDVAGEIRAVDRRMARVVGGYHGIGGSVRSVELDKDSAVLASGSLDRHLRLYDVRSRRLLRKVYVKQKVTACLWSRQLLDEKKVKKEEEGEEEAGGAEGDDDDDEGMWRELAQRRRSALKKRKGDGGVKEEEKEGEAVTAQHGEEAAEVEKDEEEVVEVKEGGKRRRVVEDEEGDEGEEEEEQDGEEEGEEVEEDEEQEGDDEGAEEQSDADEEDEQEGGEDDDSVEVEEREAPKAAPRRPASSKAGSDSRAARRR